MYMDGMGNMCFLMRKNMRVIFGHVLVVGAIWNLRAFFTHGSSCIGCIFDSWWYIEGNHEFPTFPSFFSGDNPPYFERD